MHIKEFIERVNAGRIPVITHFPKPLYCESDVEDPKLCNNIRCNLRDQCKRGEVRCIKRG